MRTALLSLAAAALMLAPARAMESGEEYVSRDGRFSLRLPRAWRDILGQVSDEKFAGRWDLGPKRESSVLIESLPMVDYSTEERRTPAAAACRRALPSWASAKLRGGVQARCRARSLPNLAELYYLEGPENIGGFLSLPNGLLYHLWANGRGRAVPSLAQLDEVLSTLRPRGRDPMSEKPRCGEGYAPVMINMPRAGTWECRETRRHPFRIIRPGGSAVQPYVPVSGCREGQRLARSDWPRRGDHGCLDFSDPSFRLLEATGDPQKPYRPAADCPPDRVPYRRTDFGARKRDYICPKEPAPAD